jgi:hypothetical protein
MAGKAFFTHVNKQELCRRSIRNGADAEFKL